MSLGLEQIRNPRLGENMFVGAGRGPVPVYVHPKPEAHQAHALLAVEYGAIDSLSTGFTPGAAHFLEHRLFEKQEGDISARFSALGADVDAQTGLTQTSFSVTCAEDLAACVELLMHLALELHLTDEGIERERRIIMREIELFADNVESVCFANALRALYPDHPISIDIAGTPASLGEIDRPLLRASHEHYYSAGRISLFAAGKVAPEELCEAVDAHTSSLRRNPAGNFPGRRAPVPAPRRVISRLAVARPRVYMAFHAAEEGKALNPGRMAAGLVGLRYPWWRIALGLAALAVAAIFAASLGSVHVPFGSVVEIMAARLPGIELSADIPAAWDTILWQLRLPRVAQAAVVGAALAMSGAAYQGLFKNPLADPYLVGVASGAGLGAVVVLLTGVPMYLAGSQFVAGGRLRRGHGRGGGGIQHRSKLAGYADNHADTGRGGHRVADRCGVEPADNAERPGTAPGALVAAGELHILGMEGERHRPSLCRSRHRGAAGLRAGAERAATERRPRGDAGGAGGEGEAAAHRGGDAGNGGGGILLGPHRVRRDWLRPMRYGCSGGRTTASCCRCRPSWGRRSWCWLTWWRGPSYRRASCRWAW